MAAAPPLPCAPPSTRTCPNEPLCAPCSRGAKKRVNMPGSTRFSQWPCSSSMNAAGMPMGATVIEPARSQVGGRISSVFGAASVTVCAARTDSPSGWRPDGTSTLTMEASGKPAFISRINSSARPRAGPRNPVPRSASTTSAARRNSGSTLSEAGMPSARTMAQFAAASPWNSSGAAARTMCREAGLKRVHNWRAITSPSPPLLPLPQITTIRCRSSGANVFSRNSTTRHPAFSIRTSPGIPASVVRRSASRICSAVRIFIRARPRRAFPGGAKDPPRPSRSESRWLPQPSPRKD